MRLPRHSLKLGKTSDISIQQNFDNSWRGLPYRQRSISKDSFDGLKEAHAWKIAPSLDQVECVFMTSDTMDDFSSYAVWAWDVKDNIYLLDSGETRYMELDDEQRAQINIDLKSAGQPPVVTLEDILDREYLVKDGVGLKPLFAIIDQGGHKGESVKHFAKMHQQVFMQKGTTMTSYNMKLSENQQRLIITNEKYFKSQAIYMLHAQKDRRENYLWVNPDTGDDFLAQLLDVQPDSSKKWGDEYGNWVSKTGKDHMFDCLKYAMLAREFALATFKRSRYRFGMAPSIIRRFDKQLKREQEKLSTDTKEQEKKNWF